MKPVRGKGTLRLEAEIGKEMWESHQITAFQALGQRKSADGFSANAGLVLSDQLDVLPVDSF